MNRSFLLKRVIVRSAAWTAMALLCGVIALSQDAAPASGQTANGVRTDGQIEMDVVHALDGSAALKNDLITAATIQSQVTLAGTVSSEDSKKLAESIVKGVPGVTGVKNNLKVGNPADDPNAQGAQNAQSDDGSEMADNGQPGATAECGAGIRITTRTRRRISRGLLLNTASNSHSIPSNSRDMANNPSMASSSHSTVSLRRHRLMDRHRLLRDTGQRPDYNSPYGPGSAPAPPAPQYRYAKGPVTIPQGTLIQVRTSEAVDGKHAKGGEPVQFTVIQDVTYGGVLAIPRGATIHGVIADSKNVGSGTLSGSSESGVGAHIA